MKTLKLLVTILFAFSIAASCQPAVQLPPGLKISPTPYSAPDTLYTLIIGGQSNAAGRSTTAEFPIEIRGLIDSSGFIAYTKNYMLNDSVYEQLETGVNSSDRAGEGGIQPSLAYDYLGYKNKDLRIIQSAEGGRPITEWQVVRAKWKFIDSSITSLNNYAVGVGKIVKYIGMVWVGNETQGGSDSATWRLEARSLFARTRAITRADLPVYIVQAIDCQSAVIGLSALQAVQASVAADTYNVLIPKSTGPNTCRVDNLHYSQAQYQAVADALFTLIKDN